jgi:multisubunit Na+/H+ antiporter MnhC subunit
MGSLAVVLIALVVYLLIRRQDARDIYQSSLIAVGAMVVLFIVSASATGTVQCMAKAQGFQNMSSLPGIACKDVAGRR